MVNVVVETAPTPTDENDDTWLYGDPNAERTQEDEAETAEKTQNENETKAPDATEEEDKEGEENDAVNDDEHFGEMDKDGVDADRDSQDNQDSDSDDSDDIKVTIGEIKSVPQSYAIKRGAGLVASGAPEKPRANTVTGNKVSMEDLDGPGSINGVPALEYNIDTIEDKPWNKPGADISDYFNYGFNELSWSAYCERQRRMRVNESGVGLHVVQQQRQAPVDVRPRPGMMMRDDNMLPPPQNNYQQSHENTIQVMTGDRREYSRREVPEYFAPPVHEPYYGGPPPHAPYEEPWGHPEAQGWAPTEIKELTPGPLGPPPTLAPPAGVPPPMVPHMTHPPSHIPPPYMPTYRQHHAPSHERERDRERDRDRERERERREREDRDRRDRERERADRERERDRDRDRERRDDEERERSRSIKPDRSRDKYRRERSRSRSRRHKSRSRSPRLRDRSRDRDRERSVKPKKESQKDKDEEKQ